MIGPLMNDVLCWICPIQSSGIHDDIFVTQNKLTEFQIVMTSLKIILLYLWKAGACSYLAT